uniref:Secreted protein n=1 Tax=Haemonchus contortus TaxID=6289 RepID=A0A7I4XU79_HAECO
MVAKSHGRTSTKLVTTSLWNAPMLSNSIRIIVTVGVSLTDTETYWSQPRQCFYPPRRVCYRQTYPRLSRECGIGLHTDRSCTTRPNRFRPVQITRREYSL